MINISVLEKDIRLRGYSEELAEAKLCQDIILLLLSKSKFSRNITIKGGVVMSSFSKNVRRATIDIDFDLIRYPLSEGGIKNLINNIDGIDGISVKIVGKIEELKHQDYQGKRIYVSIKDSYGNELSSKIDIGVHKYLNLQQLEYCFDTEVSDEGASLLINSPEQMVVEKVKSLLKFGPLSTRYKDIYDIYYLLDYVDVNILNNTIEILIFADDKMKIKTKDEIYNRLKRIFDDRLYLQKLGTSRKNWIGVENGIILNRLLSYFKTL